MQFLPERGAPASCHQGGALGICDPPSSAREKRLSQDSAHRCWLPQHSLEAFIHCPALGLCFGSGFLFSPSLPSSHPRLIPGVLAPKGCKEKKKIHPSSCPGGASGVCLDAAAGGRLFQCEKWGQGDSLQHRGPSISYHSLKLCRQFGWWRRHPEKFPPHLLTAVIQPSQR